MITFGSTRTKVVTCRRVNGSGLFRLSSNGPPAAVRRGTVEITVHSFPFTIALADPRFLKQDVISHIGMYPRRLCRPDAPTHPFYRFVFRLHTAPGRLSEPEAGPSRAEPQTEAMVRCSTPSRPVLMMSV